MLRTLGDAGHHIAALPKAMQERPEWQAAAQALLLVAERGGPTMLARIGVAQALHAGKPKPESAPRRKPAKAYRVIR